MSSSITRSPRPQLLCSCTARRLGQGAGSWMLGLLLKQCTGRTVHIVACHPGTVSQEPAGLGLAGWHVALRTGPRPLQLETEPSGHNP